MAMMQTTVAEELALSTGTWTVDANHSSIVFSIRHLGLSKVRGRFAKFDSTLTIGPARGDVEIRAEIDLSSINTNNSDRDAHLRSTDFFNTDANPTMLFIGNGVTGSGEDWNLSGDVTLNGITRPLTFAVEYNGIEIFSGDGKRHVGFSATGTIKRSEFGIDFGVMPIGVDRLALGDDVKFELDMQFVAPE